MCTTKKSIDTLCITQFLSFQKKRVTLNELVEERNCATVDRVYGGAGESYFPALSEVYWTLRLYSGESTSDFTETVDFKSRSSSVEILTFNFSVADALDISVLSIAWYSHVVLWLLYVRLYSLHSSL